VEREKKLYELPFALLKDPLSKFVFYLSFSLIGDRMRSSNEKSSNEKSSNEKSSNEKSLNEKSSNANVFDSHL